MKNLSEYLLNSIDGHIWERGFSYYVNGAVQNLHGDATTIRAVVQGTTPYLVMISARRGRDFHLYCTCPYERHCKHMAAVFFEAYESFGDPSEFLETHVLRGLTPVAESSVGFRKEFDVSQPKLSLVKPQEQQKKLHLMPSDGLDAWKKHFDVTYQTVSRRFFQSGYYYSLRSEFIWPFYLVAQSWPTARKVLYQLFVACALIDKVFSELAENEDSRGSSLQNFRSDVAVQLISECFGELTNLYSEVAHADLAKTWVNDATFWELVEYVKSRISGTETEEVNLATVLAYQLLWIQVAQHAGGVRQETEQLERQLRDTAEDSANRLGMQLALVCLLVLDGRDADAQIIADETFAEETEESFTLTISYVADSEDWPRLIEWLRFVTARMDRIGPESTLRYARLWLKTQAYLNVDQECEAFLRKGLPHTMHQYDLFFRQSKQMRKWVELQIATQGEPLHFAASFLKEIETADREALLPWYHQSIERAVRRKNRDAYKDAVKMMKKLRTHYNKLKRLAEWERFLQGFTKRYTRLRALQEEMGKKGLIPE